MGCLQLNISVLNLAFKFNFCEGIAKAIDYEEGKASWKSSNDAALAMPIKLLRKEIVYEGFFWRCI